MEGYLDFIKMVLPEILVDHFNLIDSKKQLAKLIADNFETKRTKELSENQIYKGMYSKEEDLVREVGLKWIKKS
ncbi:hypothetical protein OAT71_00590 [Flavobacteriales bacterium]|nr:hypothetical protein [Flavobacteriales bacterium]